MKYLLVIVVVWIAFMIWRSNRRSEMQRPAQPAPPPAVPAPQAMARCAH